eukprot:7180386-Pyramimonas_sp.AAC.1
MPGRSVPAQQRSLFPRVTLTCSHSVCPSLVVALVGLLGGPRCHRRVRLGALVRTERTRGEVRGGMVWVSFGCPQQRHSASFCHAQDVPKGVSSMWSLLPAVSANTGVDG